MIWNDFRPGDRVPRPEDLYFMGSKLFPDPPESLTPIKDERYGGTKSLIRPLNKSIWNRIIGMFVGKDNIKE